MNTHFIFNRYDSLCKTRIYFNVFLWGIGLTIGTLLALSFHQTSESILRLALSNVPSSFFVFLIIGFPIAVLILALAYRIFALCYMLFLLDALCRGFCGMLIFCEYGSGAWAIRCLFLFSGSCVSILLWWLLIRHSSYKRACFSKDAWFVSMAASGIGMVDIFAISPLLINLSNYF